ncbi:S1 RNA-binding domain-containing protein [Micromonospora parva]|uniref:S1 RNA-binding domain-containing protein n=1 Tax=Micromonospora parva TaxID=1464048 RepID=UPI00365C580F
MHLVESRKSLPRLYSSALSAVQPKRGMVVRGVISEIHNFGVFVRVEGDPAGSPGTGFIRVPELTWEYFCDPADVVHAGQQVSVEVLDFETTRGQVQLR